MEDWTPEPLVAAPTQYEELDNEKRPVIVGYGQIVTVDRRVRTQANNYHADRQDPSRSSPTDAL